MDSNNQVLQMEKCRDTVHFMALQPEQETELSSIMESLDISEESEVTESRAMSPRVPIKKFYCNGVPCILESSRTRTCMKRRCQILPCKRNITLNSNLCRARRCKTSYRSPSLRCLETILEDPVCSKKNNVNFKRIFKCDMVFRSHFIDRFRSKSKMNMEEFIAQFDKLMEKNNETSQPSNTTSTVHEEEKVIECFQ